MVPKPKNEMAEFQREGTFVFRWLSGTNAANEDEPQPRPQRRRDKVWEPRQRRPTRRLLPCSHRQRSRKRSRFARHISFTLQQELGLVRRWRNHCIIGTKTKKNKRLWFVPLAPMRRWLSKCHTSVIRFKNMFQMLKWHNRERSVCWWSDNGRT